ncbi:MAG: glycoside hydrolase family 99-like domain-containing protein [Candidatus Vecturithrix sp.]|jgi:hypothetical protein|nr:glycoside hydrolase family 99-like domain-containing protein [Candidatus Vecturithrix sp.]
MKVKPIIVCMVVAAAICLNGCSLIQDILKIVTGKETEKDATEEVAKETKPPQVFCTYFHYFKAGPESFDQWWLPGKDPQKILGKEPWRRDIWVGRTGDYPYIGIYNNVTDSEIMRWHIRMAKAAGISAFLVYINDWQAERSQTDLLLNVAAQENFKIGLIEHHSFLGARSIRVLDGKPQPLLPQKYTGYAQISRELSQKRGITLPFSNTDYQQPLPRSWRNVPINALHQAIERISAMLGQWKTHPAYLRIDGKPIIVIPYMVSELEAHEFKQLVESVQKKVGEDVYVVAIVPTVYWYFAPEAVIGTGITKEWAETGTAAFTHWTPNGMVTASQKTRLKVTQFNVSDSRKWKKDAMIPIMPGFEDDAWRPGADPAPTAPRQNGQAWKSQLDASLAANPRFIFIQGWNEWHEGAQIEPSTHYSDPYLYLRILAQKLNIPWQTPVLPPKKSVDPLRLPYLPY